MKKEVLERIINNGKNIIVSGSALSGKTSTVMFPIVDKLIDNNESLFMLDSKEEYINTFYKKLKDKNYNVIVLNLRDLSKSDSWNPLMYSYSLFKDGKKDEAQESLEKLGKTLFYEDFSKVDPFWSIAAANFFTGSALGLFEDGKDDEINFSSVNSFFNAADSKPLGNNNVKDYFSSKGVNSPLYILASTTFLAPSETRGGILSIARQRLRLLISKEKLTKFLSKSTFKYEDIANTPTAIFFIGKDEDRALAAIISMFIQELFSYLINVKSKNKFNFILDNIDTIDIIDGLSDMMGSGLSRNIRFYISTRSNEDFNSKYGSYVMKLADSIDVKTNKYTLQINGENIGSSKENIPEYKKCEVDYPVLDDSEIKMFNFVEFMNSHNLNKLFDRIVSPNPFDNNSNNVVSNKDNLFNIDSYIKELDKKISELDQLEFDEKKKNIKMEESELSKYKIEE